MNDKPAGLLSRIRLGRLRCHRNWDMLFVALPRNAVGGGADRSDYTRRGNRCVTCSKG
jgi:hypothetical protein